MDISFKANSLTDKDNLVLSFANGGYKVSAQFVEKRMFDVEKPHWLITVHNYTQISEELDSILKETNEKLRLLQHEFDCYRKTAEETTQCYNDSHQDSWAFEQALRRIANKSLDDSDNIDESNAEEQRQVALNTLKFVWKRREERSKKGMNI